MNSNSPNRKMFYGAKANTFKNAYWLRSNETAAEQLIWNRLNGKQLYGFRFKRQHPIEDYVADFYCHRAKLIIEIDGRFHSLAEQKLYDALRTKCMESHGLRVVRFTNDEVFKNVDDVIKRIIEYLPR